SVAFLSLSSRSSSWLTACAKVSSTPSLPNHRRMSWRSKALRPHGEAADERYVERLAQDVSISVLWLSRRAGGVLPAGRHSDRPGGDRRIADRHHSENVRRNGQRGPTRYSILLAGGRADELGQRRAARREFVAESGGAYPRWPVPGRHRFQHVLLGNVGLD